MLSERLADITAQFSSNRDAHYREQLQAIQVDINLIMESDPHSTYKLPDDPEDIDNLVLENVRKTMRNPVGAVPPPRAGRVYAEFVKEVNDAVEMRDAAMTAHQVGLFSSRDFRVPVS
jgi:hypothetical protein